MPLAADVALAEVRAYCGWIIAPNVDESVTIDGDGTRLVLLPTLYLRSVSAVRLIAADATETALASASYEWSVAGRLRRVDGSGWPCRYRSIEVDFEHGYDEMPLDVQAVIDRVTALGEEMGDTSQLLSAVGSVSYAVGVEGLRNVPLLSESSRAVLDRYRIPPRP